MFYMMLNMMFTTLKYNISRGGRKGRDGTRGRRRRRKKKTGKNKKKRSSSSSSSGRRRRKKNLKHKLFQHTGMYVLG
jgi:hypothetical protein